MGAVASLVEHFTTQLAPPSRMKLSDWAEENVVLSPEYSKKHGRLELYGWQREIFDSFTDPYVEEIVLMCGTQLVKTLLIQCIIAYIIGERPGPTLLLQPKEQDAKDFSRERLAPMIRDCPVLRGRVADAKSRDSSNATLYKSFKGGMLALAGAIVPGNLARRSIQYLLCDEIDKYPASAGSEGDPINLARERQATYGSQKKLVKACSPTIDGKSRIARSYQESDQRKPYVRCPHCREWQTLAWANVIWKNDLPFEERAASAAYHCEKCRRPWTENERKKACNNAQWRASRSFRGIAGFWISHLYSPVKSIESIVQDFLVAKKNPQDLQVFVNTNLAEEWKIRGEAPDWKRLYDRREEYAVGIVPAGGLLLTAAVDVQIDRLEFELKAWGRGKQNWSVYYEVIQPSRKDADGKVVPCRTSEPEPWDRLAELLRREWPAAGGGVMNVMCAAIDTGYTPDQAYSFCRRYPQPSHGPAGSRVNSYRTVVPIKGGHSPMRLIEAVSDTDAARKRGGLKIVTIGTPYVKQEVYDALRLERPIEGMEFPPNYCHHPPYEASYFQGLCSESRVINLKGATEWRKDGRNEPLDLHVYNRASAALCGIDAFGEEEWKALEATLELTRPAALEQATTEDSGEEPRESWIPRRNWFGRS